MKIFRMLILLILFSSISFKGVDNSELYISFEPNILLTHDNYTIPLKFVFNSSYIGRGQAYVSIVYYTPSSLKYLIFKIEINDASITEATTSTVVKAKLECEIKNENLLLIKISGFFSEYLIIKTITLKINIVEYSVINWFIPLLIFIAPFIIGMIRVRQSKSHIVILKD